MDSSFLGSKDIEWYARMFESICDFCGTSHARQSNYIDASMIPLIRLRNGTNIAAAGNQARVYLNNPASADYKIDDRFLDNQVIYDFYSGVLEIDNYDIVKEVRQSVLPKYAKREPIFVTNNPSLENDKDLKKIQEAMSKDSAIVNEVSNCYLLTDSTSWYLPKELHIRSIDTYCGYGLIKNKSSLKFLSDDYSYNFPDEFFERIGCPKGLALQEVTHSKYLVAARKYLAPDQCNDISIVISKKYLQTRSAFFVNYEGFPEVFQDMSPDRSLQIMRFLNANASSIDIKGDIDGADNKKFVGNVETRNFYTYLGLEICFEKWIYDKDGKGPQRPVDIDQDRLLSTYAPLKGILRKLPLKDNTSKIKNLISTTSLSDRQIEELASHIVASPDELYKMMKAKEKSDAREAAKKHVEDSNIEKTIEKQNVKQQAPKAPPAESEVPPISKTGIEMRTMHLEEEFYKSMASTFSIKHGFSFALKACTEEEKEFLRQEYRGRCQICHTSILKADGTQYFEAIQIIKRSVLAEDQQGTLRLGWNTLCLCPNCAAKYNYGSKDLSGMCQQILQAKIVEGSDEPIGIDIVISGCRQTIDYSPRHLMALQKALELSK